MPSSFPRDRWTAILLVIIVLMGLEIVFLMYQNQKLKAIMEDPKQVFKTLSMDDTVPSIAAYDLNGNDVSLRYGADAPRSVLFWFAPTCPSCEDNIEFWKQVYADWKSDSVRFLGMCAGQPDEASAFAADHEIDFPVMCVTDPYIMEAYKGNVLPQTVLISSTGTILGVWPGALDDGGQEQFLARLKQP